MSKSKSKTNNILNITITGNPATKKNSSNIYRTPKGKPFISTSTNYKKYLDNFKGQILEKKLYNKFLNKPYNVKCEYYMQTKRKVDLTNLLSATMDCLVSCGVLEDDNCLIAVSNDGSRVYYDKNNPRVEIEIKEVEQTFIK